MKLRAEKTIPDDQAEHVLVEAIKAIDAKTRGTAPNVRPDQYWANLLVRTNSRIDDATSPRAISISWAARVAIPGVVAVLSFVVALHYYAPVQPESADNLATVIRSLPEQAVDSLLVLGAGQSEGALPTIGLGDEVLRVPSDQITDYFIENGEASQIVETMNDGQVDTFYTALSNR